MFDDPILAQAELQGGQKFQAQESDQNRFLAQFMGQRQGVDTGNAAALQGMFGQQRRNASFNLNARLGEAAARQLLHKQRMDMFYKQLAFQQLQQKWAHRDENAAMIATGIGSIGQIASPYLGQAFKSSTPSYDPMLESMYQNPADRQNAYAALFARK